MTVVVAAYMAWVTAYCCLGVGGGYCHRTASGVQVAEGQAAADWRVLPKFSRIRVQGYGEALVTDTGGAIKGTRLDVFKWRCEDAWRWGRRYVQIARLVWVPMGREPEPVAEETGESND